MPYKVANNQIKLDLIYFFRNPNLTMQTAYIFINFSRNYDLFFYLNGAGELTGSFKLYGLLVRKKVEAKKLYNWVAP